MLSRIHQPPGPVSSLCPNIGYPTFVLISSRKEASHHDWRDLNLGNITIQPRKGIIRVLERRLPIEAVRDITLTGRAVRGGPGPIRHLTTGPGIPRYHGAETNPRRELLFGWYLSERFLLSLLESILQSLSLSLLGLLSRLLIKIMGNVFSNA